MLHIIKISPTVGKAVVVLVTVSEKNEAELHSSLVEYSKAVYGEYASIEYLQQFAVPAVYVGDYKVSAFINADEFIANKTA